jgi:BlaI family penicillinase repressor
MKLPRITDAEREVMKVVWRQAPCSSHDVVAALASSKTWSVGTIKTLLNRLHSKGALRFEKVGKSYLYRPTVTEDRLRNAEADSFLERIFDGALSPMIKHLARNRKLSEQDLDELEGILKEKRR